MDYCSDLEHLGEVAFPRYSLNSEKSCRLHLFCDASKEAYGCVLYAEQDHKTNLIFSKSKLSPKPQRTLPQLEYLGYYLGIKWIKTLLESKNFSEIVVSEIKIYLDSQVALSWILKGKALRKNVFINNRISEIKTILKEWTKIKISHFYVPSEDNIADLLTRGVKSKEFKEIEGLWFKGPPFILKDKLPQSDLGSVPTKYLNDSGLVCGGNRK